MKLLYMWCHTYDNKLHKPKLLFYYATNMFIFAVKSDNLQGFTWFWTNEHFKTAVSATPPLTLLFSLRGCYFEKTVFLFCFDILDSKFPHDPSAVLIG